MKSFVVVLLLLMLLLLSPPQVILNPHLFHGAFLLDSTTKANVIEEVRGLLATSGSLVVRLARPVVNRTLSAARSLLHEVETLTSRLSIMSPSQPHRQQPGPDHHGPPHHMPTARQLRRTLTDLPAHAWQRIGSFGRGNSTARATAAAAAVAAAGSGGSATGRTGSDITSPQASLLDRQQQELRAGSAPQLGRSVSNIERYSSGSGSAPLRTAAAAAAEAPAGAAAAADDSNTRAADAADVPSATLAVVRGGGASRHRPQLAAIPSGSDAGVSDGEAAAAAAAAGVRSGSSGDGSESWEDLKQRTSSGGDTAGVGGDAVQARDVGAAAAAGGEFATAAGEQQLAAGGGGATMKGVIAGLWQQVYGPADKQQEMRRVHTTPAVVQHSQQQQQHEHEPLHEQVQREAQQLQQLLQQKQQLHQQQQQQQG
jgi:hypothetical protein